MKRYALFSGAYNLMMGGVIDFKQSYHTEKEAFEVATQIAKNDIFTSWVQIFDKKTDTAKIYSVVDGKLKERKDKTCPTGLFETGQPQAC
ncbi:hypothetical protein [uncultured Microbulbifer sp.]|uniref:hypothetical protein n=1 Tax=uncultured Microbulbifer sp. TaxID=348147 RepID=UPI0026283E96|nr:hypothetical protein [uncultured Microbulbifer sp.]